MIPPTDTFAYRIPIPARGLGILASASFLGPKPSVWRTWDQRFRTLVGYSPEAWFLKDRIILSAHKRNHAMFRALVLSVPPAIMTLADRANALFLVHTPCGGFGLALTGPDSVLFAKGALTKIPWLAEVGVRCTLMFPDAERDISSARELQIQVTVPGSVHVLTGGLHVSTEQYEIRCIRGFLPGEPATDEDITIVRQDHLAALPELPPTPVLAMSAIVRWPHSPGG